MELLLTQAQGTHAAMLESERAELVYEHATAHVRAAAAKSALRQGAPTPVARAVGMLTDPPLPAGARAFWAELGRWRDFHLEVGHEEVIGVSILEEMAAFLELPPEAAPALVSSTRGASVGRGWRGERSREVVGVRSGVCGEEGVKARRPRCAAHHTSPSRPSHPSVAALPARRVG